MPSKVTATLSAEDAALFFELMWSVQAYVNRRLGLLPNIQTAQQYARLGTSDKFQVRQALWKNPPLLDAFVAENPNGLAPDQLQSVASWKHFVSGNFFVVRFLKRHAIFVADRPHSGVYAVAGLNDRIEDVVDASYLPIAVEAVLLPFKGRIIYDGLLASHSIFFGPGIAGDLNELYQSAKQKGAIIESLEPGAPAKAPPAVRSKQSWRPALDRALEAIEQVPTADAVVPRRALAVLKVCAQLAQGAANDPADLDELYQLAQRAHKALDQFETVLRRAE